MTTKVYVWGTTRTYSDRPTAGDLSVALATSPWWPHVQTTDDLGRVTHIRPPASIATDAQGRWSVELVHAEGVQYLITCDGVTRLLDLGAVDGFGEPIYPEGAQVEWATLPSHFVTPPPPLETLEALVWDAVEDYLTEHPPTGVTDHGELTGLDQDDHPQYLTTARGDARYVQPGALGPTLRGQAGRKYAAIGGTIRNDGAGFQCLDDVGHRPTFIDSITTTSTYIRVNYTSAAANMVTTFIAAPDETFAAAGFSVGTSVNKTYADIFVYKRQTTMADYVYYDGTNWLSTKGILVPAGYNTSTGVLTLTHDAITSTESVNAAATARGGRFMVTVESINTTSLTICFRTASTTAPNYFPAATTPDVNMKAYVVHGGGLTRNVDPTTITTAAYPGSNFWLTGFMETT